MGGSFSFEQLDESNDKRIRDNIKINMERFNKSCMIIAGDLLNANNFSSVSDVKKQCLTYNKTIWIRLTPVIQLKKMETVFGRRSGFDIPSDLLKFEIDDPKHIFSSMSLSPEETGMLCEKGNNGRIVINKIKMKGNNSLPLPLNINLYNIMFNETEITLMEKHRNAKVNQFLKNNKPVYTGYLFNHYNDESQTLSTSSSSSSSTISEGDGITCISRDVIPDDGKKKTSNLGTKINHTDDGVHEDSATLKESNVIKKEKGRERHGSVRGESLRNVFCAQVGRRQIKVNNEYNKDTKRYICHSIREKELNDGPDNKKYRNKRADLYGNGVNIKLKGASSNIHDNNSDKEVYTSSVSDTWLKNHATAERGCLKSRFTFEMYKEPRSFGKSVDGVESLDIFMEDPEEIKDENTITSFKSIDLKDSKVYKKAEKMVASYIDKFEFYFDGDYMLNVYRTSLRKDVSKKGDLDIVGVYDMELQKVTLSEITWNIADDGGLLLNQTYSKLDQCTFEENIHRYKKIYAIPKTNCDEYRSRLENSVFSKLRYFDPDNPFLEIIYDEKQTSDYLKNVSKALDIEKEKMDEKIKMANSNGKLDDGLKIIHLSNESVDLEQIVIVLDVRYTVLKPNSLF